jgi:hypothetical protein
MTENDCSDLVSLVDWIKNEPKTKEACRPCALPVLASWYKSELDETGNKGESEKIIKLAENVDATPQMLAAELDRIKADVKDEKLRARLKEFDCSIQHNE